MTTAHNVGQRSLCSRAQYGAVIVSEDNRILAVGYNGVPATQSNDTPCINWCQRAINAENLGEQSVDPHYMDCHVVHAEVNAILRADNLWQEKSPRLYVNGVTCLRCALTIANSGIKEVVLFIDEYEQKRDPLATKQLLEEYGVNVRTME